MADMSLSDRYDYLKAAKASIYNNVKEGGVEEDGAGLKIKGAPGKGGGHSVSPSDGDEGTVTSARERACVVERVGLCPMEGEQSRAVGLLSRAPETTASSVAPTATPALGADKGPPPEHRLAQHTGEPFWIWHHPNMDGHHHPLWMCCSIRWECAFN